MNDLDLKALRDLCADKMLVQVSMVPATRVADLIQRLDESEGRGLQGLADRSYVALRLFLAKRNLLMGEVDQGKQTSFNEAMQ